METSQTKSNGFARLQSIDILRGAVMIIMAIDHVRVYSGMPAGGLTTGIFFTRWITHFCAPAFVFFAGTSAFLYLQKSGDKKDLVKFLVTRGLLLVLLELTVVRCSWMFNFDFVNFTFTGVIWTLGWCMVILAAFLRLRPSVIGIIGLIIIFAQQLFQFVPDLFPSSVRESVATIWGFFYPSVSDHVSGAAKLSGISGLPSALGIRIFYVLVPWLGTMMAGYGFGQLLLRDPITKRKICLRIGFSAILLFLIAGTTIILLEPPDQGNDTPFIFKLLGQQKYPPSQLYLLMTIGPLIVFIPWADKIKGWFADSIKMIGRVPMFYYLLHIPLIHLSAFVVNFIRTGSIHQDWYVTVPFLSMPEEQRWGLPLLYVVWVIDVIILYFVCKWYAKYKSNHPEKGWLKYL